MGWVYFIQADKHIKIGYSVDPMDRLSIADVFNPYPVSCLGLLQGERRLEYEIHTRFKNCRVRGEWFDAKPVLKWLKSQTLLPIAASRKHSSMNLEWLDWLKQSGRE